MTPMAAGVAVSRVNSGDAGGGEAARLAEELVAELARRRGEEGEQETGRRQQPEPAAVAGDGRLDVRRREPAALGQVAGHDGDERQVGEGQQVEHAPGPLAEVGQRQRPQAHPGPERLGHGDDRVGPGPAAGGHLLGRHDPDEEDHRAGARPGQGLGAAEGDDAGAERAGRGGDDAEDRHRRDEPPAPDPVGPGRDRDDEQDAGPHGGEEAGLLAGAQTELVGGERRRLGEDGAEVAPDHRDRQQEAEHPPGPLVEALRWGPPRTTRVLPAERPAVQGHEDETPERRRRPEVDGLEQPAVVEDLEPALVVRGTGRAPAGRCRRRSGARERAGRRGARPGRRPTRRGGRPKPVPQRPGTILARCPRSVFGRAARCRGRSASAAPRTRR